jgi:uncharacterized membrane protein
MHSKWLFIVSQLTRRMWFRAALYGVFGVVSALIGALLRPWMPHGLAERIGADAVGHILGILASSMLAVTTFSLSIMVSAYAAASSSATPRASRLLIEDAPAQSALASFIGAFLFSIVGLIALSAGIYGESGRLVLFAATIVLIVVIVITLLRWIDQLSRLGRVGETINRVERATHLALREHQRDPWLGGVPYDDAHAGGCPVESHRIGYVQYVDAGLLQAIAEEEALELWVEAPAGTFVAPGRAVALASQDVDDALRERIAEAFVIGDGRDFRQDPRFGFVVLTEIAQRALSPAVNDPGTAIDVLGTVTRLLCEWARDAARSEPPPTRHDRVHVRKLDAGDCFDDVYAPLARDAAGMLEVGIRMRKSLVTLATLGFPPFDQPARRHAARALELARQALPLAQDMQQLESLAVVSHRRPD